MNLITTKLHIFYKNITVAITYNRFVGCVAASVGVEMSC